MNTYLEKSVTHLQSRSDVDRPVSPGVPRSLTVTAVAIAAFFAFVSNASAADLACKPDIYVKNERAKAIKVLKFGYKDDTGEVHTENLSNRKLANGEYKRWKSKKLQHVAKGNVVSAIRIKFKTDTSGEKSPSSPWGSAIWSTWHTQTEDCDNSKTYYYTFSAN